MTFDREADANELQGFKEVVRYLLLPSSSTAVRPVRAA